MSESPLRVADEEVRKKIGKGPLRSPPPARRPRKKDAPPPIPTSNLLRFPLTTAQSAIELTSATPANHDTNYIAISGGIKASSMLNLVWNQQQPRKSTDLQLSSAQLSNMGLLQRPGFGIRVELPNGVISVLLCHHAIDLLSIVHRAVSKTKTLLGIAYDLSDINSVHVFPDTDDMHELAIESVVTNIPYVVACLQKKVQPAFIVQCPLCPPLRPQAAVHHGAEPTSAIEENEVEPWDEENKSAYGTLSKASFKNLRMSFHKPRSVSNASQTDRPIPPLPNSAPPSTGNTSPAGKSSEQRNPVITVAEVLLAASSRPISKISAPSVLEEMEVDGISKSTVHQPKSYTATFILPMELISRVSMSSSLDAETTITMTIGGSLSIKEVKENVCTHRKMPPLPQAPDQYCLKFTNEKEQEIVLFDEDQIFRTVSCVKYRSARSMPIVFNITLRNVPLSKQAQRINKSIGALIGFGLYRFERVDPEIDYVRRRLVNSRREAVDFRDPKTYTMEPNLDISMPAFVKERLMSNRLQLRLHVNTVVKTTTCKPEDTPSEIIQSLLRKKTISLLELEVSGADKYVLKVSGIDDYLTGEHPMINYAYIRKCILKDERINLILVARPEPVDLSRLLDDYDLIEECPGLGTHAQLTVEAPNAEDMKVMSLWDVTRNYRIMISECIRLTAGNFESVYVEAGLYYGGVLLCPIQTTPAVKISANPKWNTWLTFDIATCNLPKSARLCLTVYSRWNSKKRTPIEKESDMCPLGWVSMLLMNYKGILRMGPAPVRLPLWPGEKANPIGTCVSTENSQNPALILHLEEYEKPVLFPTEQFTDELRAKCEKALPPKDEHHVQILEATINSDPLTKVTDGNATLLWRYRYYCTRRAEALPKIILATRWNNLEDVLELQKLLPVWAPMTPEASLELLDANFPDEAVRTLAVSRLEMLSDESVLDYLLQLVQVLKYEPFHDSALSRFLLKRALKNRILGHYFFWHLRSEMSQPEVSLRFGMLLEAYLRGAENHMEELMHQNDTLNQLLNIAGQVKSAKTAVEKRDALMGELSRVNLPNKFTLSLNPRIKAKSIIVEKCKYMDSKKLPLWCVFDNADARGSPIYIIFKSGDDLRQDMLTLQMIGIMDKLWQGDGLDLRMTPYRCIATGHEVGMIEVVLNAETVSNIQLQYGGSTAAFKDQPLDEWIRKHNVLEKDYVKAVETFTYSCAGYCVATYVLGIGDRHNDNIMVTKSGHLFHIDFGHFLGNIKRKFGIKRERAPFVLTPDFVYVMGRRDGEQFKKFVEYCVQAYLILRRKANMFINLFAMMLSTGIPELKSSDDIQYLRDALCIGMTEEAAANEFRSLIFESLRLGWSTQLNWWLHNLVHSK